MKIYARQVAPEYQRSPFVFNEDFFNNIAVCGNDHYYTYAPEIFKTVKCVLDDGNLADIIDNFKDYSYCYDTITDAIIDFLPPVKRKYSINAINALKKLVSEYTTCSVDDEKRILCSVLTIMTGEKWSWQTIEGNTQTEWNNIYYPVDKWTREALKRFECEYFNTGSEWIVHEDVGAPEKPEDIVGYPIYCISLNEESIKAEIAEDEGVSADDVVLYAFDGYCKTPRYRGV